MQLPQTLTPFEACPDGINQIRFHVGCAQVQPVLTLRAITPYNTSFKPKCTNLCRAALGQLPRRKHPN